jgi:hypothetical protein
MHQRRLLILTLDGNPLGDAGAAFLANAIKYNRTLHTLSMHHTQLTAHGQTLLGDAIGFNVALRHPAMVYLSPSGRTLWLPKLEERRAKRSLFVVAGILHTDTHRHRQRHIHIHIQIHTDTCTYTYTYTHLLIL